VDLRPSLTPPRIDTAIVPRLAALVKEIDLLPDGEAAAQIAAFNTAVGSTLVHQDFREYFASQSAEEFARAHLIEHAVTPTPGITREEIVELLRRAMSSRSQEDVETYHALLRVNGAGKAIGWIYWPPDADVIPGAWDEGREIGEYDPSAEQIAEWLFAVQLRPEG
jgi:hypothetical protein